MGKKKTQQRKPKSTSPKTQKPKPAGKKTQKRNY